MTLLPPVVKPMTDSELYEATQKELAFFMDENTRLRDELVVANKEIERMKGLLKSWEENSLKAIRELLDA